jgi:hypothetical protein
MEMPKPVTRLHDMEIDEVSVVDKGAAADALIAIAKRATQEVEMPEEYYEYYAEDGSPVDVESLEIGDIVFDGDGNIYEYVPADAEDEIEMEEPELELVGKNAFGFSDEVREVLSKAFSTGDNTATSELFSKAAAEIDSLQKRVAVAETVAKAERDARLIDQYIAKADSYNLPGDATELGPVLFRMAETMSYEDCSVINKALTAAGSTIFDELGYIGGGDNNDILSMVSKAAEDSDVDMGAIFDANPDAYAEYLGGN